MAQPDDPSSYFMHWSNPRCISFTEMHATSLLKRLKGRKLSVLFTQMSIFWLRHLNPIGSATVEYKLLLKSVSTI